jgi:hypothetical protein
VQNVKLFIVTVFLIFGFWRRVDMLVDADVSEKHTVSIFIVKSGGRPTHGYRQPLQS